MSINMKQNSDGTLTAVSNVNSKIPLIIDEQRGSYQNDKQYVEFVDDFLGDVIEDGYSAAKGSDGQAVIATIVAGEAGGVVRQTTGDTAVLAESAVVLTHALNWKANMGGLYMYTRFKPVTSVANVSYFVGFTDTLGTTTLEMPMSLSGTTLTTTATDAVGFLFDTDATNDFWHLQGVKADTDTALLNSAVAPVADTAADLEIWLDTSGNATFAINGAVLGTVANCVTATVALTPVIAAMARTTTSKSVDTDILVVRAQRA